MSNIRLIHASCANQDADAVVNAANDKLLDGGGFCKVIFERAGKFELQQACNQYTTPLKDGEAVITPAFNIQNAKAIIHAVGPNFAKTPKAFKELYEAYYNSLVVLKNNDYHTIAFPLISSGIFGGSLSDPAGESTKQCIRSYRKFTKDYPDYEIDVTLCAYTSDEMASASKMWESMNDSPVEGETDGRTADRDNASHSFDQLKIDGKTVDAVFFHKPEEPYGFLSNWYPSVFEVNGQKFTSAEQFIMYKKCMLFGDEGAAQAVMATDDVETQQSIGRKANGYLPATWNGMRQVIAFEGLMAKFSQNEDLKQQLLATGNAYLVECAGRDKVWACGIRLFDDRRFDARNWDGTNILGFVLMEVREEIRRKCPN